MRRLGQFLFTLTAFVSLLLCVFSLAMIRYGERIPRPPIRLVDNLYFELNEGSFALSSPSWAFATETIEAGMTVTNHFFPSERWCVFHTIICRLGPKRHVWWTLYFDTEKMVYLSAGLPAIWMFVKGHSWWKRSRPAKLGHCKDCGYDLRASKEACPECGEPIAAVKPPSSSDRDETKPASDA